MTYEGPGDTPPGPSTSNASHGQVTGALIQAGVIHGDINLVTGAPVRTWYREQVRRIAPLELIGREPDLRELESFCTTSANAYRWIRAEAWTGKSALLSWFVLNPPPGVRIVSFFITARLAAQNDRNAFIDNVLEQLLALLGQEMPPFLTEANREAHLLALLGQAADTCRARGETLVLLVDGLDEDRGVTTGPHAYSIAALLPARPPPGLRVLVAGRPNPPIPVDVPSHHPLRSPDVVRPLAQSLAAKAERADMERELRHLLAGSQAERDLLGFLTAAGGGLTAVDLAHLTGRTAWEVEDHLRVVTGRSFMRSPDPYGGQDSLDVFLLGHEELHQTAIDMLGPTLLAQYRNRIHVWAESYRNLGWPQRTPEYLLHGYYSMLSGVGETSRMVACATDPARHDRLSARTGGDMAATAEIAAVQKAILAHPEPDLAAMGRLAVHHERLVARNAELPLHFPALWVHVGRIDRARALAGSMKSGGQLSLVWAVSAAIEVNDLRGAEELTAYLGHGDDCGKALEELTKALCDRGDLDHARRLRVRAESGFLAIRDALERGRAVTSLVRCAVHTGDLDRAAALAQEIAATSHHDRALCDLVEGLAARDDVTRAITVAGSISDQALRGRAGRAVVDALIARGHLGAAEREAFEIAEPLARDRAVDAVTWVLTRRGAWDAAESLAGRIVDPVTRGTAQVRLARAMVVADRRRARELLDQAVVAADAVTSPGSSGSYKAWVAALDRDRVLVGAVRTALAGGERELAERWAVAVVDVRYRANALEALTTAALRDGDVARAQHHLGQAEGLVDVGGRPVRSGQALLSTLRQANLVGGAARARSLLARELSQAESAGDLSRQVTLTQVAITVGEVDLAATIATSIRHPDAAAVQVVRAFIAADRMERADRVIDVMSTPHSLGLALGILTRAFASAGDNDRATANLLKATAIYSRYSARDLDEAMSGVITVLIERHDFDRAATFAGRMVNRRSASWELRGVAWGAAWAGERTRSRALLDQAADVAQHLADVETRDQDLGNLVTLSVRADTDQLRAIANLITDPTRRRDALNSVIRREARLTGNSSPAFEMDPVSQALADDDIELAQRTALASSDSAKRDRALRRIVDDLKRRGEVGQGVVVAGQIQETFYRHLAIAGCVEVLLAAGDVAAATKVMASAPHEESSQWSELGVNVALASGDLDRAVLIARTTYGQPVEKVVAALVEAGDLDRAEELALGLNRGKDRWAVGAALTAMWGAGHHERTRRLADRAVAAAGAIESRFRAEWLLKDVVKWRIGIEDFAAAEALTRSWTRQDLRADALGDVAAALLRAGSIEQAVSLLDSITTPEQPFNAMVIIKELPVEAARRVMARVLTSTRWTSIVKHVCRADVEAMEAIVDELEVVARRDGVVLLPEAPDRPGTGRATPD